MRTTCMNRMGHVACLAAWMVVGMILYPFAGQRVQAQESSADLTHAVLVIVDSIRITQDQLDAMALFFFKRQHPERPLETIRPDELETLANVSMRELIILALVESKARKENIRATATEVDQQAGYMGVTLEDIETREMGRRWVRGKIYFNKLMAKRGMGPVIIRPSDVRRFYNEHRNDLFVTQRDVRVRHIFLSTGLDPVLARKQAHMIHDMLSKQTSDKLENYFSEAAREFSQGRFRSHGGLLLISGDPEGWFPQHIEPRMPDGSAVFPASLNRGIRSLIRPGQLSDVIESETGFHILYLVDARGGQTIPFSDAQVMITRHLEDQAYQERMDNWLKRAITRSHVVWHDGTPYPPESILAPDGKVPDDLNVHDALAAQEAQ